MKKNTAIIIAAAIIGALVGSISGYLFTIHKSTENLKKLSADQGAKVGLNIISLVKQIADLGRS